MNGRHLDFEVTRAEYGSRLDRLIVAHAPGLGRKRAAALFASGMVRVDGKRVHKGALAHSGQRVSVELPEREHAVAEADVPLDILLERDDLVVVNKRAGQPSAALRTTDRGTITGALLARYPEMLGVGFGPREPGIIHRLDTQTSGALVAARSKATFLLLRSALETGKLDKRYLALVDSNAIGEHGIIDAPLGPHPKSKRRVSIVEPSSPGAHAARSIYRVLERSGGFALVEVTASRAYRHQVRVHLASHGCPIVGDLLYGGRDVGLGERHALHASYVACDVAGVPAFAVTAPLPEDMRELLRSS
jgi:23S rRNA pseudouridine1911/1915/1917 synthase